MRSAAVTLAFLGALCSGVSAAPAATTTTSTKPSPTPEPATVHFFPYKFVGCRQSQNPHDPQTPTGYNVTSGHCVNTAYAFGSYVESGNDLAVKYCSFALYPNANCKGTPKQGVITSGYQCVTDSNANGQSVYLTCGP